MSAPALLVVDDDRGNCAVLSTVLSGQGYAVDVAHNGADALRLAEEKQFLLAILDYEMPGMDGVELYRHIREIQPDLVAVFLTAYTTIDHVYAAVESGAERVLSKPVDFGVLIPLIEELVGKAV
jgi:two-component system response regulator (stage 0 sporulation protein F)